MGRLNLRYSLIPSNEKCFFPEPDFFYFLMLTFKDSGPNSEHIKAGVNEK